MSTFELIPYRLYLSQSKTWMHRIKAEIKIYIVILLWISIFIFSYFKLFVIVVSLIILSFTIRNKQSIIQQHLVQTLFMTLLTTLLSFSFSASYRNYSQIEQSQYLSYSNSDKDPNSYQHIISTNNHEITKKQIIFALRPSLYFFITLYSMKLVMITTSPEILVITIYKSKIINKLSQNEALFIFLLSSHIVNNVIHKLDKVIQITSLRGQVKLWKSSKSFLIFSFLIFQFFFLETLKESKEISKAFYTRNLNQENNNFFKIYTVTSGFNDWLHIFIGTLYFVILALA